MKALVYTAPRKLEIQELSVPQIRAGMALVRVRAAGVCGSDLDGFLGRSKRRVPPLVLGHEFSGEIAELGPGVQEPKPGERVAVYPLNPCGRCRYCATGRHNICPDRKVYGLDFNGAFSEYICAPAENLFCIPNSMSFVEGALVEPLANAVHVLDRVPKVGGATALVYGAGSIGLIVLWLAKRLGASRTAVVDTNTQRLAKARALGADLLVDPLESNPVEVILEWTGGRGVDFAIDAVGHSVCRSNTVACVAPGGSAVWIGLAGDQTELDGRSVVTREIEIKGSYAYSRTDFQRAIAILAEKNFPVALLISEVCLGKGQSVFDDLAGRGSPLIKPVFIF